MNAERVQKENKNSESLISNYQNLIIKMVLEIKNEKLLQFICDLLVSLKKKWGI